MLFKLEVTFYSIVAILMYSASIVHAQEISIREILEQKRGAKIDTFYYANYADAVNEIDYDHGLETKDCLSGIVVLQYKGVEKWDIYKYDFTELLSTILKESKTEEGIAKDMGENYETPYDNIIFKQIHKRLKEVTTDNITEHIDTNTLMSITNSKPEIFATIHSPYDHSMYVKNNGKYQTIGSKHPYDFTIYYQVQVSVPSNEKSGFVGDKSCSNITHISDTLINSGRDIPSYPLAGIWFVDDASQYYFLSNQNSFSYTIKTGERIEKYYNLGLCFIAKVKDADNREYLVLFNENGRKELSIQYQAMIHDNQYMISGDGGSGYERSLFSVISDDKETYVLETQSTIMVKAPKGFKPLHIDNVSAAFPELSHYLSDYLGMYPIFKNSKKYYFYDGKTFIEITKKYLKNMPFNREN